MIAAAVLGSVALVGVGSFASGFGAAAVALSRYAAVGLGPAGREARAVSGVLAAVAVGAVAGPNLLAPAAALDRAIGLPASTSAFALAALTFLAAAATWSPVATSPPAANPPRLSAATRSVDSGAAAGVARSPGVKAAIGLLAVANLVMVATMTMAPVQLHHIGGGLALIGGVVSIHIAAMFAPAPLSGWIVDRYGIGGGAAAAGATLLSATTLAAFSAHSVAGLTVAVGLLGLGWSAAVVTGSTALVRATTPERRPRAEAAGEVGMALAAGVGGAASGVLVGAGGYALLATTAAACVAAGLIPLGVRLSGLTGTRSGAHTSA
ncbi:hypothetical protein [Cryptosporangium arvum]|uniref:hypothetical protein n=1 Tax=Cryptosporangium arvum TaxID=80871 RepID=UPI0004BC8929|nr:hypothetical protein [Cryptosporangium arvum]